MGRTTGTVPAVLSRAVITIVFLCHGAFWTICSAQPTGLPPEFFTDSVIDMMRQHFCAGECLNQLDRSGICWHLNHNNKRQQKRCSKNTDMRMCREVNHIGFCGYNDAVVCQLQTERGYCVFRTSSCASSPFCTCQDCDGSLSTSTQQGNYCEEDQSKESTTSNPVPETTTSLAAGSTTTGQPSTTTPPTPAPGTHLPTTTPAGRTQTPGIQRTTPSDTSQPAGGSDEHGGSSDPVNIAATVVGVALSLALVGAILVLFLWRRGKRNSRGSPGDESIVPAPTRAHMPDLPIASSADEYSYAYGHCSQAGETSNITGGEDHYYFKLAKEGDRRVSNRYSRDRSRVKAPERDLTTVATNEHQYFVLERQSEDGTVAIRDGDATASDTMATEKCSAGSGEDCTYLHEGVMAGSSDGGDSASLPYEHLSRAAGKRMNEGALSGNHDGDYQHLMGNMDYDHLKH